eukprot:gene13011-3515_t
MQFTPDGQAQSDVTVAVRKVLARAKAQANDAGAKPREEVVLLLSLLVPPGGSPQ